MICPEFQLVCKISRPNVAFLLFEGNKKWEFPRMCAPGPADGDVSRIFTPRLMGQRPLMMQGVFIRWLLNQLKICKELTDNPYLFIFT